MFCGVISWEGAEPPSRYRHQPCALTHPLTHIQPQSDSLLGLVYPDVVP